MGAAITELKLGNLPGGVTWLYFGSFFTDKALQHKVKVCPVSPFWLNKDKYNNNALVLGYGMISENDIPTAIKILSQAWFN